MTVLVAQHQSWEEIAYRDMSAESQVQCVQISTSNHPEEESCLLLPQASGSLSMNYYIVFEEVKTHWRI